MLKIKSNLLILVLLSLSFASFKEHPKRISEKIECRPAMNSISTIYKRNGFVSNKSRDLLPLKTIAPNWTLLSLTNEKINLEDFKGQLVLIDFFVKACYPCVLALPSLQALSEKYKAKGVKIIGIDPYDKKDGKLISFLRKRGVTFPVLLGNEDIVKDYRVFGYPTMYLIDRDGRIIFTQAGYGGGTDEELEEIIQKNL